MLKFPTRRFLYSTILILILSLCVEEKIHAQSAKDSLLKLYSHKKELNYKADLSFQLAMDYTNRTQYDSSLYYLNIAYESFIELNDDRNIMNCYLQYGILESYKGNYTLSANYFLRTLIYADKINDKNIYSTVYINLASVYSALEEHKKAKYYLLKIDKNALKDNLLLYVNYLGNMGQLEYELQNYTSALSYLNQGIEILSPYDGNINLIQLFIIAGDCAYELNNFNLSLSYYNKANLKINKKELPLQYAHLCYGLAKLFKKTNTALSLNYANSSMEYAKMHQIQDLIINNYLLQSEINELLGNTKEALTLLKKYQSAKDSLSIEAVNKNIQILEQNYELIKSKTYIEKLQLINEKNQLKIIIYLTFTAITILTSIFLFYLLKKRNQLNKQLKSANVVKDKLLSIISHDLKSPLNNIVAVLDGIAKDDYSKKELEVILNSINNQALATVNTLDNILHWGKAQLRGINVHKVQLTVADHIKYNIDLHASHLINKKIEAEISGDLQVQVYFDKDHLDFILRNFISNAIKFSYVNTKIKIEVSNTELETTISVIDFGVGVQSTEINNMFSWDPSIKTGTSNEKGTGLALGLCKEFADYNEAIIGYKNIEPKGTMFFLIIKN